MHKHGKCGTAVYRAWKGIIDRCTNPNSKYFDRYQGRGITVCERWKTSFENFYSDMGEPPVGQSIDRIDNNLGYSPENCRWATRTEQQNNRRCNVQIAHLGKTQTVAQWARELGINRRVLYKRLYAGWTNERALTTPLRKDSRHV